MDEHYYNSIGWYFHHRDFYDHYDRQGTKVYLGEWASKGNNVVNALVEAAYLTHVERNADVVVMSSYAPLLAKEGHTNWNPDLIYFNNTEVHPTANYYVQRAFGHHAGSQYVWSDLKVNGGRDVEERLDKSVVIDESTGDIIIKVVSLLPKASSLTLQLGEEALKGYDLEAQLTTMAHKGDPSRQRAWDVNETRSLTVAPSFTLDIPQYSFSILRIRKAK